MGKVIQVIFTDCLRGSGVEGNPFRNIVQYWSLDGELLAERDQWQEDEDRKRRDGAPRAARGDASRG